MAALVALVALACDDGTDSGNPVVVAGQGGEGGRAGASGQGGAGGSGNAGAAGAGAAGAGGMMGAAGQAPVGWHFDASFGVDGFGAVPKPPLGDFVATHGAKLWPQPDGKILLTGPGRAAIVRMLPDGQPDPSFGDKGIAAWGPDSVRLDALAVQPDGKIVAGGHDAENPLVVPLVRFLPNGQLDPSFGQGGTVAQGLYGDELTSIDHLSIDPEGAIVVAGTIFRSFVGGDDLLVLRTLANGSIDETFGPLGDGIFYYRGSAPAPSVESAIKAAVVVRNEDSSYWVAGSYVERDEVSDNDQTVALVLKVQAGGTLEPTWGDSGAQHTPLPMSDRRNNLCRKGAPRPGGGFELLCNAAVVAFSPDGELERDFGDEGLTKLVADDGRADDFLVSPDGSTFVVGLLPVYDGPPALAVVHRLRADGSFDPSFGERGTWVSDLGHHDAFAVYGAAVTTGGGLLVLVQLWGDGDFDEDGSLFHLAPPGQP